MKNVQTTLARLFNLDFSRARIFACTEEKIVVTDVKCGNRMGKRVCFRCFLPAGLLLYKKRERERDKGGGRGGRGRKKAGGKCGEREGEGGRKEN